MIWLYIVHVEIWPTVFGEKQDLFTSNKSKRHNSHIALPKNINPVMMDSLVPCKLNYVNIQYSIIGDRAVV